MRAMPLVPSPAMASFKPPFDRLSPTERLRHFRTRSDVHFFPVPDAEQVQRSRIDDVLKSRFTFNNENSRSAARFRLA